MSHMNEDDTRNILGQLRDLIATVEGTLRRDPTAAFVVDIRSEDFDPRAFIVSSEITAEMLVAERYLECNAHEFPNLFPQELFKYVLKESSSKSHRARIELTSIRSIWCVRLNGELCERELFDDYSGSQEAI